MASPKPCIGILTSGGDCPGLNAVIRAAVISSDRLGYSCVGFLRGYEGLVDPVDYIPLTPGNTSGTVTSYQQSQLANYSLALNILGGGSSSGTSVIG